MKASACNGRNFLWHTGFNRMQYSLEMRTKGSLHQDAKLSFLRFWGEHVGCNFNPSILRAFQLTVDFLLCRIFWNQHTYCKGQGSSTVTVTLNIKDLCLLQHFNTWFEVFNLSWILSSSLKLTSRNNLFCLSQVLNACWLWRFLPGFFFVWHVEGITSLTTMKTMS